jgi:hypothetical protein
MVKAPAGWKSVGDRRIEPARQRSCVVGHGIELGAPAAEQAGNQAEITPRPRYCQT